MRRERARPLSPDERRDELIDATLSLLREHGRAVTTRQIAEAAGVAEGTIFRVVESKEELVELAITRAFEPGGLAERIGAPDLRKRLEREGLIRLVDVDADRFRVPPSEVVQMIRLLTFSGSHPHISDQRMLTAEQIVDVVLHGTLRAADSHDLDSREDS